jgi:hypothetical protein
MHPYLRVLVLAAVAIIVAGALIALALAGRNTTISILALLGAGLIGIATGGFLFAMSWIWSQRTWHDGRAGRSILMAVAGGIGIVVAAVALAASVILVLTFLIG